MFNLQFTQFERTQLWQAISDTFLLIGVAGSFILVLGLIFGYLLFICEPVAGEKKIGKSIFFRCLSLLVDGFRAIPFVVLIFLILPFTLWLVGTMMGPIAALPALIISATPFFTRIAYNAYKEVPKGQLEALSSMGCGQVRVFYLTTKEALPALVKGFTVTLVTLVGFIAAAGVIGTGGLGLLARRQFDINPLNPPFLMYFSVILLLVIVLFIQITGDLIAKKIDRR